MNHPKPEEWVPYVFGEAKPEARTQLRAHLESCAECRETVRGWQRSLGRLDAWELPRARQSHETFAPFFKWAVAAAVVLCLGFGIGRLTAARADLARVRAALEPELRRQIRQDVAQAVREQADQSAARTLAAAGKQTKAAVTALAETLESRRVKDYQAISALLEKQETQRFADYLSLKKDLDTVAVYTDAGLRQTEQQLVQLTDYRPASVLNPPQN